MEHFLKIDINYTKEESVFFPGEKVEGVVCIELRQPVRVDEFYIELCGELNIRKSTITNAIFPSLSRSRVNIVNMRQVLIRSSEITNRHLDIQFSFTLPKDSPQSLESWPLVEMRYFTEVIARFPSTKNAVQLSMKRLFTVLEQYVPDNPASVCQASRLTVTRPTHVLCCGEEGYIEAQLNLRKTYFVPGEDVVASILVDNQSSKLIKKVTFSIRQVVVKSLSSSPDDRLTGHSRLLRALLSRTVRQSQCIGTQEIGPVAPNGLARHRRCKLHLAAVPCTAGSQGVAGSRRHIDLSYVVQLRVMMPCCRRNLVLTCPFIVGTSPLPSRSPLLRSDVTDKVNAQSGNSNANESIFPSAFVESAVGPIVYRSINLSQPCLTRRRMGMLSVYTPQYFYFPTISIAPKPGTPSTLRSILKPRSMCSSSSAGPSSVFSDTASTMTSYVSDSYLNIHFESPV